MSPSAGKAGVTHRSFKPTAARNWRGASKQQLDCTIWYPASPEAHEAAQQIGPPQHPLFLMGEAAPDAAFEPGGGQRPLILLSHGTGGSAAQMAWLGTALARAGMIAVAVDHPGNNASDHYTPEGFLLWWERATDLSEVLDGMLADTEFAPHIDRKLIGAAGFSLGGYTVLELAGAQTDLSAMVEHCHEQPQDTACRVPEMKDLPPGATLLQTVRKTSGESLARSGDSFADPRIRAVFAIAPALGYTLTDDSLRQIRLPVEIVVGAADPIAGPAENADRLRALIHGARETVLPGGVAHYTFLDLCTETGKQELPVYCVDNPGVDRNAIHQQVSLEAIGFFQKTLRWR